MERDPVRDRLRELLWQRGLSMREASIAIGRNAAYLHQFLERGMPKALAFPDTETLARLLRCEAAELRHATVPKRKRWTRKSPVPPALRMSDVSEMEVDAAAGGGALNDEVVRERARWRIPEGMVRHEGGAEPESLRILRVRGNSMEPEMRDGDRVVVDTARQSPATGELFVLWDGNGLVVKRVEAVGGEPAKLRLLSANADYPPYTCLVEEARIVGKVVWKISRT